MIKNYAAIIDSLDGSLHEVPLFVNFWPDESSDEVTYVRLKTDEDAKRGDAGFIGSIPVRHPAGIRIDNSNWAGFLHLYLTQQDKMRKEFTLPQNVRGCLSVQSYPSFGCYCFVVVSSTGNAYGIVVDRPSGSRRPVRLFNQATIIKTPYRNHEGSGIYYDDHGLVLKKERAERSQNRLLHDLYHMSFSKPLTGSQILRMYLDGFNTLNITSDIFHKATDEWELQFFSVEGFEYFKSVDGEVLFTLQKNPVPKALNALKERMKQSSRHNALEYPYEGLTEFYALYQHTSNATQQVLEWVIRGLEHLTE